MSSQTPPAEADNTDIHPKRLAVGYVVVVAFLIVAVSVSISIGSERDPAPAIGGFYTSESACLGDDFKIEQSGQFVDLSGSSSGKLRLQEDRLEGTVNCAD